MDLTLALVWRQPSFSDRIVPSNPIFSGPISLANASLALEKVLPERATIIFRGAATNLCQYLISTYHSV